MSMRFSGYRLGKRYVSVALSDRAIKEISQDGLAYICIDHHRQTIVLQPDDIVLSKDASEMEALKSYNDFDVFEIMDSGVAVRRYNAQSGDNYFFITGKCNSNCIMCPSSEYSRKNSETESLSSLIELANHIPLDVPHLTITGGEPFLMGESIFSFLAYLKDRFVNTEFLFLTNGRVFCLEKYLESFCSNVPYNSVVAIPLHGSCESVHDSITRTPGSFRQTVAGIKNLLKRDIPVEIRLVVSLLNVHDFENIAELIIKHLKNAEYVSIIAMEMTGTARVNKEQVWVSYKESFEYIETAVRHLVKNGVSVKLYNFPLCTVAKSFWPLCQKSISDYKVRFASVCEDCRYKNACSGVFSGTLQLEEDELRAIP